MLWILCILLVVMILTNAWMERRISALERQWNEYMSQKQSFQGPHQAS